MAIVNVAVVLTAMFVLGTAETFSDTASGTLLPMLVDRDVRTPQALFTSLRAVGENPVTMVWWALFLLFATGFSVATLMLGFLVLYPVMGHASWYVYRDLVDASALPRRSDAE